MITVDSREDFLTIVKGHDVGMVCVELGCYRGDFSQQILQIIKPAELHLIDPFEVSGEPYGEQLYHLPSAYSNATDYQFISSRFKNFSSVKIKKGYSYNVVKLYEDNYFDLIYIDASHLQEDVTKDLNDWLPKLKRNGIMAGHDYVAFDSFGVIPAVDKFCQEHNFEMFLFNRNGGDFALRKKS